MALLLLPVCVDVEGRMDVRGREGGSRRPGTRPRENPEKEAPGRVPVVAEFLPGTLLCEGLTAPGRSGQAEGTEEPS